jgi:hypothetical protein
VGRVAQPDCCRWSIRSHPGERRGRASVGSRRIAAADQTPESPHGWHAFAEARSSSLPGGAERFESSRFPLSGQRYGGWIQVHRHCDQRRCQGRGSQLKVPPPLARRRETLTAIFSEIRSGCAGWLLRTSSRPGRPRTTMFACDVWTEPGATAPSCGARRTRRPHDDGVRSPLMGICDEQAHES